MCPDFFDDPVLRKSNTKKKKPNVLYNLPHFLNVKRASSADSDVTVLLRSAVQLDYIIPLSSWLNSNQLSHLFALIIL